MNLRHARNRNAAVLLGLAVATGACTKSSPPATPPPAQTPQTDSAGPDPAPEIADVEPAKPEAEPPPPPPKGCWETNYGSAPEGTGVSLAAPIDGCEGCETLRAGPAASDLHPAVLEKLLKIQTSRPAPPIDEPVLWVNSGKRDGKPSQSMHNQGLAIDMVVCGLDSPGTAKLLREAGFSCVIEYYDADGNACNMAHADLRGTEHAKAAYAPGAWKSKSCPGRAVSKGEDCQNQAKTDWSYAPTSG